MKFKRSSGILLHITSLPGKFGIGDLGKSAYEMVDFLADAKQKLWQILPTGPTGFGNSPYQTYSAFAGNPLFIDLDKLVESNLLSKGDLEHDLVFVQGKVDFDQVRKFKASKLEIAYQNFDVNDQQFIKFIAQESFWLNDFAFFMALKEHFDDQPWIEWKEEIKVRQKTAINEYQKLLQTRINYYKFCQFVFFAHWQALRKYANDKGVKIIGDIPIFVSSDSSDAWSNPEIFQFDEHHSPIKVAGVPPDYFSETGQLWGNPLYDWKMLEQQNFEWWIQRFKAIQKLVDIVRVDHFRGFVSYWAVPAGNDTAIEGSWEKALGDKLFTALRSELGELPIIAEDLGIITPEVAALRDAFDLPGMKILQFAFDSDLKNEYLPHNYSENCVAYTGTHDNDTVLGWFLSSPPGRKDFVKNYIKREDFNICCEMIKLAWMSKANIAIAPLQDFLCLDNKARMNTPGTTQGNWQWKLENEQLTPDLANNIKAITQQSSR
ncbi:MAG: 4-alpha-glucanotransferase [Candidatus Cloacimonetes bacterium]|nr:4-alpha-glucanotransferase [Candidatus Cloacimonadota bacterium]